MRKRTQCRFITKSNDVFIAISRRSDILKSTVPFSVLKLETNNNKSIPKQYEANAMLYVVYTMDSVYAQTVEGILT
jgi:hypothetical protein